MTHKDQQATAAMIRGLRAERIAGGRAFDAITIDAVERRMASIFEADNPKFSRATFAAASAEVRS